MARNARAMLVSRHVRSLRQCRREVAWPFGNGKKASPKKACSRKDGFGALLSESVWETSCGGTVLA